MKDNINFKKVCNQLGLDILMNYKKRIKQEESYNSGCIGIGVVVDDFDKYMKMTEKNRKN